MSMRPQRFLQQSIRSSFLVSVSLILLGVGCAERRQPTVLTPPLRPHPAQEDFHDLRGIIHVHSNYSKDSEGVMEGIVEAAADNGLDFVIVTDHDTLAGQHWEGTHRGVLLLVDEEVNTHEGHLLALNVTEPIPPGQPAADAIQQITAQGGLAFVSHPFGKRRWEGWGTHRFAGIEIHNLASDAYWLENKMFMAFRLFIVYPFDNQYALARALDYPHRNTALWDRLMVDEDRQIVGIAGTNVHHKYTLFGHYVDNYRDSFRMVETRVLARERSAEGVYEAHGAGRVYIVFQPFLKGRHVSFSARSGTTVATLGQTLPVTDPVVFDAQVNRRSQLRLIWNGTVIRRIKGTQLHYQAKHPGFYRLEVFSHGHPVILTNPIRITEVRPPAGDKR